MLTRPGERHASLLSLPKTALTALTLAALLAVSAPMQPAQAQDLPPAAAEDATTAPATAAPDAAEPAAPAAGTDGAAGSPPADTQPAETPAPGTDAAANAPAMTEAETAETDAQPQDESAGATGTVSDSEAPVAPQPMPSIFEDPAGALNHMLAPPERRADLPHDLSPWGMFMAADIVVKAVMVGLVFASLVTWTVWLAKVLELGGARSRASRMLKVIRSSASLSEAVERAGSRGGPAALMLRAAQEEARMSEAAIDLAGGEGLKERVGSAMNRIEVAAGRRISKGTGVLATIGSTSPFVGLFGTVWGIMNSFIGISEAQTTNLAVVAPGIAEALLATALGLVAAIPAVVIYNSFARSITGYRQMLGDVGAGVERLVSRDLDFRQLRKPAPVHASAAE